MTKHRNPKYDHSLIFLSAPNIQERCSLLFVLEKEKKPKDPRNIDVTRKKQRKREREDKGTSFLQKIVARFFVTIFKNAEKEERRQGEKGEGSK